MDEPSSATLIATNLPGLELLHRGKVRDVYALDAERVLIVATDRLSAFDVVLPDPIPGKGAVLTAMSNFWFAQTRAIALNHLLDVPLESVLPAAVERRDYIDRSVVARRLRPLPVEAIVRGYIAGSGWKNYQATGGLCGVRLPAGLRLADALPQPMFTPSTKAAIGDHDENISFDAMVARIGGDLAEAVRSAALAIYRHASTHALARGIIVADTKLEFGVDDAGNLSVIDELLTPDSSRFWAQDLYRPGASPPSFDKQFVRDYLETLHWNQRPPAPRLPAAIIAGTAARYAQALARLTGPAHERA